MFPAAVATDRGAGGGGVRRGGKTAAFDQERAAYTDDGGRMESIYNLLPRLKEKTVRKYSRLFNGMRGFLCCLQYLC